jgi:S-DNA-T family DNA segregation ATPase FtsK/SpoIIIE
MKDCLYGDAKKIVIDTGRASVSQMQRRFRIGYHRASLLIDILEREGIIGPYDGAKPRKVLVDD